MKQLIKNIERFKKNEIPLAPPHFTDCYVVPVASFTKVQPNGQVEMYNALLVGYLDEPIAMLHPPTYTNYPTETHLDARVERGMRLAPGWNKKLHLLDVAASELAEALGLPVPDDPLNNPKFLTDILHKAQEVARLFGVIDETDALERHASDPDYEGHETLESIIKCSRCDMLRDGIQQRDISEYDLSVELERVLFKIRDMRFGWRAIDTETN